MPDAKLLFEALVREHAGSLTAYLMSVLGNSVDVDDLFQETMVVAWKRLDDFDQSRSFGPWLRGIARNLVAAHGRSVSRRRCTPLVLDRIEERLCLLNSRQGDTWKEKLGLLHDCVESLPDNYRHVVGLRYFQQQAIQQVSEALVLSTDVVKKRLQRARSMVLECINKKLRLEACE